MNHIVCFIFLFTRGDLPLHNCLLSSHIYGPLLRSTFLEQYSVSPLGAEKNDYSTNSDNYYCSLTALIYIFLMRVLTWFFPLSYSPSAIQCWRSYYQYFDLKRIIIIIKISVKLIIAINFLQSALIDNANNTAGTQYFSRVNVKLRGCAAKVDV